MSGRGGHRPGAGRPAGSKNKRTYDVESTLQKLECNPIEALARIAAKAEVIGSLDLAGRMYKELASYVAPKRRAVDEVHGNHNIQFQVMTGINRSPKDAMVGE
jgi:hypothetical protein